MCNCSQMRALLENLTPAKLIRIKKSIESTKGVTLLSRNISTTLFAENGIFPISENGNRIMRRDILDKYDEDEIIIEVESDTFVVDGSFYRDREFLGQISTDFIKVDSTLSTYSIEGIATSLCLEQIDGQLRNIWFDADGRRPLTGIADDIEKVWGKLKLKSN